MSRTPTADEAADYLIALAHQREESLNNLKLQRLLYYVQAWHMALYDRPLFNAKFQAWMTGPVIPSIYFRFKPFGIHDIPTPAEPPCLSAATKAFLDEIASEYLPIDEYTLDEMSCSEAPWLNARGGRDVSEPCDVELSEDDMRAYFRRLQDAA